MTADLTPASSPSVPRPLGLWYGLLAPPIAWLLQSLASFWLTTKACHDPRGAGSVRSVVIVLALVAFAITLSALGASIRARRELGRHLGETAGRPRRDMMALGGIFLAITLGLGILFAGLPALLLGKICEATR